MWVCVRNGWKGVSVFAVWWPVFQQVSDVKTSSDCAVSSSLAMVCWSLTCWWPKPSKTIQTDELKVLAGWETWRRANKQCYQRVQFTLNRFPIKSPSKMRCTSQTLTHPAICSSSEALIAGFWWHVNNTLASQLILRTVCVHEQWQSIVPSEVRLYSHWLKSERRTHRIRSVTLPGQTAEHVAPLSALTCHGLLWDAALESARTHTHRKKQLTREPTDHASSNFNRRH